MVYTFMNLPEGFLQAVLGCMCPIAPPATVQHIKGMVINGINNVLLRDALIIALSLWEQTIFQELLWRGRQANLRSGIVFMN